MMRGCWGGRRNYHDDGDPTVRDDPFPFHLLFTAFALHFYVADDELLDIPTMTTISCISTGIFHPG